MMGRNGSVETVGSAASAMRPHGLALRAYFQGDGDAQLVVRRDDGFESPLPVSLFFRSPAEFSPIEVAALEQCRGHVLDIGAGTGLHTLALQSRGVRATAIDVSPDAVDIMRDRGVIDVQCCDVRDFAGGPFDALLLLGHGIGMAGDLTGLNGLLRHLRALTGPGGHLLVHSLDVRRTADPVHLRYHEANRRAGRYVGSIRTQFRFGDQAGAYCDWLHVDHDTLKQLAAPAGWSCEVVREETSGEYLARLGQPDT
jgi:SAM-dependent methyltransferase